MNGYLSDEAYTRDEDIIVAMDIGTTHSESAHAILTMGLKDPHGGPWTSVLHLRYYVAISRYCDGLAKRFSRSPRSVLPVTSVFGSNT
jgi:hypothetical protein